VGGFEGGPDRVPLASKLSVALHMGQTRGPAFLAFKWAANLAYLPVSSIVSPLPKNFRGILTDFPLGMNYRYGGLPTGLLVPVVIPLAAREPRSLRPRAFGPGPDGRDPSCGRGPASDHGWERAPPARRKSSELRILTSALGALRQPYL
jgi:hypothetical protein